LLLVKYVKIILTNALRETWFVRWFSRFCTSLFLIVFAVFSGVQLVPKALPPPAV